MGRPWITVVFDIATRVVLGFALRLDPPSATSVGLALTMACLPKDEWLKERHIDIEWAAAGVPKLIHVDNGKEFHSLALRLGCERYGISLEYRPSGRPQFGAHIERYLGTLMRRIHGLPGTTYSNPIERGKYRSEARATMTMAELERWMALEIAGRYHQRVHRGVHAIPAQLWAKSVRRRPPPVVTDPARFVLDFLPADSRRVGRNVPIGRVARPGSRRPHDGGRRRAILRALAAGERPILSSCDLGFCELFLAIEAFDLGIGRTSVRRLLEGV